VTDNKGKSLDSMKRSKSLPVQASAVEEAPLIKKVVRLRSLGIQTDALTQLGSADDESFYNDSSDFEDDDGMQRGNPLLLSTLSPGV
jgi:hypothetical protein